MSFDDDDESLIDGECLEGDEGRFIHPLRGHFIHSDEDFTIARRSNAFPVDRPVSSPGDYPNLDLYVPPGGVYQLRAEEETDTKTKTRIDAWMSRLDRLISDPSQTERSSDLDALVTEMTSSHETLTYGSSSSTEVAETDDDEGRGGAFQCHSLDEVLRGTECHSTLENNELLATKDSSEKPVQSRKTSRASDRSRIKKSTTREMPSVEYRTGTTCSNIDAAYEILNTRYKLEDIAVAKKPIITWSKWNVSDIVRGPHEESPIWNPELQKRYYDRPDSIVFRELDKDINRRNEELEKIVKKKTAICRRFVSSPDSLPPPPPPPHISPTPKTSTPISFSASSPAASSSSMSSPCHPVGPDESSSTSASLNHDPTVNSSSNLLHEMQSQRSSQSSPVEHPSVIVTTEDASSVASPSPPAAEASPSSGFGLFRKMVKSFWSLW